MIKAARDLAEQTKKLPQGDQLRNILSINNQLSSQYKNIVNEYYSQILQPISQFLSNNQTKDVKEILQQSTNTLNSMLNQYHQNNNNSYQTVLQHQHPALQQQTAVNLLDRELLKEDIIQIFKTVLSSQKYPLFTPYMSSFPNNSNIDENLKIISDKECDLRDFKEQLLNESPCNKIINQTDQLDEYQHQSDDITQYQEQFSKLQMDISIFQDQLIEQQNLETINKYFEVLPTNLILQQLNTFQTEIQKQIIIAQVLLRQKIQVITKDQELKILIEKLNSVKIFAIQIFTSDQAYYIKTCYLAIQLNNDLYIIDTLELQNSIYKLRDVLLNNKIIKVLYSSEQIAYQLQFDFRLYLNGVIDVKVLYQLLYNNHSAPLSNIIADVLNFQDFVSQYEAQQQLCTDFALRHISDVQIKMMQLNLIFLIPLNHILILKLKQDKKDLKNKYNEIVKSYLTVNVQEVLKQQNQQIFNKVFKAANERSFYIELFYLYVDVLARKLNVAKQKLFSFNLDSKMVEDVNLQYSIIQQIIQGVKIQNKYYSTLFSVYLTPKHMSAFDSIAKTLHQKLTQSGNFNQQSYKYKLNQHQIHNIKCQQINYEQFCKSLGLEPSEAQQIHIELNQQLQSYQSKYIDVMDTLDYEFFDTKKKQVSLEQVTTNVIPDRNQNLQEYLKVYLKSQQRQTQK